MTTFISSSPLLAMPCFALAPNRLMLAVIAFPHGSATALVGASTLSQAHFIQPGRALEAEFQVKSSFRKFYSYTCSFVSHQNRRSLGGSRSQRAHLAGPSSGARPFGERSGSPTERRVWLLELRMWPDQWIAAPGIT